jgi:hypothetical protein
MKRILLPFFGLLILYVIYIDLTEGTLPGIAVKQSQVTTKSVTYDSPEIAAFEAEVKPGETLISIVENHLDEPLPVSIDELIKDFEALNPGQAPEKINIGSSYQFPDYSN